MGVATTLATGCASSSAPPLATSAPPTTAAAATTRTFGQHTLTRKAVANGDLPNILFISIDDLNDWVGFLGTHPGNHTPNFDALAGSGLSFTNAHTPAPMCLPARNALLYGDPPYVTGVYDHTDASTTNATEYTRVTPSLIDYAWAGGYETFGTGKVFHGRNNRFDTSQNIDFYLPGYLRKSFPDSGRFDPDWISPYSGNPIGTGEEFTPAHIDFGPSGREPLDDPDGLAATWAMDRLAEDHQRPLFLAFGTYMPHVPWRVPQQYFDLHPLEDVVVPEIREDDLDDLSDYARGLIDTSGRYRLMTQSNLMAEAVQAYQASISYADDMAGRVLNSLADSRYADETTIVLWSDHGYHLGEKMHIHKLTLWERATRVPLVLGGAGIPAGVVDAPVSTMDMAGTIAAAGDFALRDSWDSEDLVGLVADPSSAAARPPVTTWLEGNHAVRTDRYRYIRYVTGDTELYDHSVDQNEWTNIAADPANAAIVTELDGFLPAAS